MTEPKTHTLEVPGCVVHYDVREAEAGTAPMRGFLDGEFGMKGDPDAFAVTLRQVLAQEG
jgi:hypothetical protein